MSNCRIVEGGVASAQGFRAAGVPAGIKYSGRNDVALVVADCPCEFAGVFTTNQVAAAPVKYDRQVAKRGRAQAIFANSGCANACTGERGARDVLRTVAAVAKKLDIREADVLVASTGVIGRPLPMDRLLKGLDLAADKLEAGSEAGIQAAQAIMTTDTRMKQACVRTTIGGKRVTVGGMTKGSGMIEPNMATMLGFITTDAAISRPMLKRALLKALDRSFNRVVVDGDESTNDSLFLLASGRAGNPEIVKAGKDFDLFLEALSAVAVSLAKQMAADGEGATKFVTVNVRGAKSDRDAEKAARAIAKSPLAKTSWFGKDPNWGRVLAAVGYSGAEVDERRTEIFYDKVWAFRRGQVAGAKQLEKLAAVLARPEFSVTADLHLGDGAATIYTCDFSLAYVHINADYTT